MALPSSGKLVRDGIPEIIRLSGGTPRTTVVSRADLRAALNEKLQEEIGEYLSSESLPDRLEELADILEVIRGLLVECDSTLDSLITLAEQKKSERGGFVMGTWLL